jgi:hypothetical protein
MGRLRLPLIGLLAALLFGSSCFTESDRRQWGEVLSDLRGDDMQMHSHPPQP